MGLTITVTALLIWVILLERRVTKLEKKEKERDEKETKTVVTNFSRGKVD